MKLPSWEDWIGINELFIRYVTALDSGDVEGVVACFAEDGSLQSSTVGTYSGRDGIREFASRYAQFKKERGGQQRHMLSNLSIRTDNNRGKATCYFLSYLTRNDETAFLGPGRYECDLTKVGGEWVFQNRFGMMDRKVKLDGL